MNDFLIETKNITKKYADKIALNDFSINIPKGSIYGILGPNGAGKTTFIRILNQITVQDSGSVLFEGNPLNKNHIYQIGYMPEERGLYKNMKIGEQVLYLAQLKGLTKKQAQEKLNFWFEKLNIEKWWNKKLSELSKGMAQKIQFIVTVLHDPKLLIFDEPFSGFDPLNAQIIQNEIIELKQKGTTIIFSSHRMESVEQLCDYVCLINNSQKILDGSINQIKEKYKYNNFFVKLNNLTKDINLLNQKYKIENIIKDKNEISFIININSSDHNQLINELSNFGNIINFNENIPSMNDIFIKNIIV